MQGDESLLLPQRFQVNNIEKINFTIGSHMFRLNIVQMLAILD